MSFAKDCKKKNKEILYGKHSKCKHCECISAGAFGCHYICANKNSKNFRMTPPICTEDCDGYEQDYGYGVDD